MILDPIIFLCEFDSFDDNTSKLRSNNTGVLCNLSMVSPTRPSVGTEGAFGWGLTRIFAPGVGNLTDYHMINYS